jgi:uncharacterized SAM-binding protein YcdF (DUF218 family)
VEAGRCTSGKRLPIWGRMRELLKLWCVPGSASCFCIMAVGALPLVLMRTTRWLGVFVFLAGLMATASLTVPAISEALITHLTPAEEPFAPPPADAVVLLLGDNPRFRVATAARVFHQWQPRWVIVSGPPGWAQILETRGVPASQLLSESRSQNTYEQAVLIEPLVKQHRIRRMFLVASRLHIRRAAATFRSRGYDVIAVASPIDGEESPLGWRRFVPNQTALGLSRDAVYEYAAWSYYWWQGWLSPFPALGTAMASNTS